MAKCKAENVKTKSAVFEIEWSTFQIFCLLDPRVPYTCQTIIPDLGLRKYEQQSHDPV